MAKQAGPQSGKSAGGAPPFATPGGKPTNAGGAARNLELVSSVPPTDPGDSSYDVDAMQTPQGGRVLLADPGAASRAIGAQGNDAPKPFKNLK